jgi:chemotaxis response regulator CheB
MVSTNKHASLLHLGDNPSLAGLLKDVILHSCAVEHLGIERSGPKGLQLCRELSPTIILLGAARIDLESLDFLASVRQTVANSRVLFFAESATAYGLYRFSKHPSEGIVLGLT